jgi:DNA-binding NtrC family response regulator
MSRSLLEMTHALVVEDDPRVANLCARLLAGLGMQVRIVGTAKEARDAFANTETPFGFAYIDVTLPDGSGIDVAAEAKRRRPTLSLVVATGRITKIEVPGFVMLHKPFTLTQFESAVEAAMGSRSDQEPS